MFSIRSKVSSTPIPSYASFIDDTTSSSSHRSSSKLNRSRTKKRRKKKRKASEIVNINDYPSAKRRRISIVGVDVDPKKTKEIIQNKDFLLCEYHSNFPQFLVNQLKSIPKHQLTQSVSMKSCDNQWIIAKIQPSLLIYWNTSSHTNPNHIHSDSSNHNNHKLNAHHHPNSPSKCFMIELNKCIIYDPHHFDDESASDAITPIADMEHIHLLYPCASSLSTLKPHRPFKHTSEPRVVPNNPNKYNNPFMPHALNKNGDTSHDKDALDDSIIYPLFPSSTARSMTAIAGIVFLSSDHRTLYVIPHDHVTTIAHESDSEHMTYGTNRNTTYKIPLLTDTIQHNERISTTQILPQPRVGTGHSMNTYKILMGTTHGRLFYITLIINKTSVISKTSDVYFDHGTDLSAKVIVRDHELLFAFCNESQDTSNREDTTGENVGWLGFVVSKIKLGANALSGGAMDEDALRVQMLKESGQRYDTSFGIASVVFGLNENCTKVVGYTLRKQCIDCIEFTDKEYNLLWSYSLRSCLDEKEEPLCISLLGQGLSVLSGYIDGGYGHCLIVRLFKINPNGDTPLVLYGTRPIQLPTHIRVNDLHQLRYESFWSYYNDKNDANNTHKTSDAKRNKMEQDEDDDVPRLRSLDDQLQRQTSMAEFVEQRQGLKNEIIQCQHELVAPFGMLWSTDPLLHNDCDAFIAMFPLLDIAMSDEIWDRLYGDYGDLYPQMLLDNTVGPDGDHFNNGLVSTFELRNSHMPSTSPTSSIPFYGGGCMLLPYDFGHGWRQQQMERNEDDEKQIVEKETTDGGVIARKRLRQLGGGGYGYFLNEKYQIMRIKYSLQCAMASKHADMDHYERVQREEEAKKMKMNIRLAFSEFRNGKEGQPRAHRLSYKLLGEKHDILSSNVAQLSESILDLKLFDTFRASDVIQSCIQSVGFNTNKMRLGMSQMDIKVQTYEDYMRFLHESPSSDVDANLWCFIHSAQKCDMMEHREYLEIARHLYNYCTNSADEDDHYGQRRSGEEEEDDDVMSENDDDTTTTTDDDGSRSSLSNFGDSNHSLYRQKYFALKKGFIAKLLQCIISKRGDIEYIHTFGNDEYDTFFMKIAQMKQILTELPRFLESWLAYLTYKCFNEEEVNEVNIDVKIENERDELVHQLISIRIALEVVECVISSGNEYRSTTYDEVFDSCCRISWNYDNRIRCVAMHICKVIVPYMNKIAPLLCCLHHSSDMIAVIDTDNSYYDYMMKKERNQIYRSMNEMSRMIMESYSKELHLLRDTYKIEYETLHKQFERHRSYLVSHLYDLFPSSKSTNYDRWKTDLVKDAVHKIAFDYGDCEYLVKLCDPKEYAVTNNNILRVCHERFIDNFTKYKYRFLSCYLTQHEHNIDAFLCLEIQKSDIWKPQMKESLDECISRYVAESMTPTHSLSILNEYSWIHKLSVSDYVNTAKHLCDHNEHLNLDQQTVHLSMAKLSVFAAAADDALHDNVVNISKVEEDLLWLNAKELLRSYRRNRRRRDDDNELNKREIVLHLMKEALSVSNERRMNVLHMEQILCLIFNLDAIVDELNEDRLIVMFIEHVIDCNATEWRLLLDMYPDKEDRVMDNSMLQIINRTVVYKITKYLCDKKRQAQFIKDSTSAMIQQQQEDDLWQLWDGAINHCTTNKNKKDEKYYFIVRALSFAQSNNNQNQPFMT